MSLRSGAHLLEEETHTNSLRKSYIEYNYIIYRYFKTVCTRALSKGGRHPVPGLPQPPTTTNSAATPFLTPFTGELCLHDHHTTYLYHLAHCFDTQEGRGANSVRRISFTCSLLYMGPLMCPTTISHIILLIDFIHRKENTRICRAENNSIYM